ncbi:MAG: cobalamin-dependent protein, partial [Candidatus Bathyarchaeia archaeon]
MSGQKTTFVFIFPPYWSDYKFHYHLGVGYVQAFLEEKGIDSLQYVPKKAVTPPLLVEEVLSLNPEFIGFTCYDSNYYMVKMLAHLFKRERHNLPIIVGGPTATFSD